MKPKFENFEIGETVVYDGNADGKSYYGTIRKIEITEDGYKYYVAFHPSISWIPFDEDILSRCKMEVEL